jgi:adenylosuccinate lyase
MSVFSVNQAVDLLVAASLRPGRNLQMPGDPHYQPKDLRPYLGYDQRVGWQILAEWGWFHALARTGVMPAEHGDLLTPELLSTLLLITTTEVTELERKPEVGHDVLALLMLMRERLPAELHPWLHWGATSYDAISTAFALQAKHTFHRVFYPKCREVDALWVEQIERHADTLQIGRTHLQDALPVTVGFWLSPLHRRFVKNVRRAGIAANEVLGKWSGATGTANALRIFAPGAGLEESLMEILELPPPDLATQIPLPEELERFYHEITLVSAALANLGEDVRHLQSSAIGEVTSASSTSSTMSHKTANPIAAENLAGMHVSVRAEFAKVLETLGSDLQRDLRYSNVMRGYGAVIVFAYQQLMTAHRLFRSFGVDVERCKENFWRNGKLVVAELLHLYLQGAGYPDAHAFVNKKVVPHARKAGCSLADVVSELARNDQKLALIWGQAPESIWFLLQHADQYRGRSVEIARVEVYNRL